MVLLPIMRMQICFPFLFIAILSFKTNAGYFDTALYSLGIKEGTEAFIITTNAMKGRSYKEQAIIAASATAVFTGSAISVGSATAALLNVDVEDDIITAKNAKRLGECILKGYGAYELNKLQDKLNTLRNNQQDVSTVPLKEVLSSILPSLFREGAELGFGTGFSLAGTLNDETKMTAVYASLSALGGAATPVAACALGYGMYKAGQCCGLISDDFFDKYTKPINTATNTLIESLKIGLASGAMHEFAELQKADIRVWDLGEDFSHKTNPHWGAAAAVTGYTANPDIFQLSVIICGWAKYLSEPSGRAIKRVWKCFRPNESARNPVNNGDCELNAYTVNSTEDACSRTNTLNTHQSDAPLNNERL